MENNLKSARKMKGLSLRKAAKDLDLSHEGLRKFEHGKLKMDSSKLIKFANYYGVSVDNLLRNKVKIELKEIRFFKPIKNI